VLPLVWSSRIHLPGALRSTGVTRLRHYYGSSDSCRAMSGPRQVSSLHVPNLLAIPSPTTPRRSGCLACFRNRTYRRPRPIGRTTHWAGFRSTSFGLRHGLASSPRRQAESSSSSYGLVIHLPMLSTSPRGDAVPVDYGGQAGPRQGLTPCWFDTLAIARVRSLRDRAQAIPRSPVTP
jgi:hypothetical protein